MITGAPLSRRKLPATPLTFACTTIMRPASSKGMMVWSGHAVESAFAVNAWVINKRLKIIRFINVFLSVRLVQDGGAVSSFRRCL